MNKTGKLFTISLIFAIILLLIGCTKKSGIDGSVEENKALLQRYIDEMNRGNESYLDEYFASDYRYHGAAGELDADGFKAIHSNFLSAFPDAKASIEDMIAVGDKVATRWKICGTHTGEFQGLPPTGKKVTITGIIISQVKDGKVVEEWEELNQLSLMQQLGVIPLPQNKDQ
jgi:steroid delta-isomerase-like uncharacterized protein